MLLFGVACSIAACVNAPSTGKELSLITQTTDDDVIVQWGDLEILADSPLSREFDVDLSNNIRIRLATGRQLKNEIRDIELRVVGRGFDKKTAQTIWRASDESGCLSAIECFVPEWEFRKAANDDLELPNQSRLQLVVIRHSDRGQDAGDAQTTLRFMSVDSGYFAALRPIVFYTAPITEEFWGKNSVDNLVSLNVAGGLQVIEGAKYTGWSFLPTISGALGLAVTSEIDFETSEGASKDLSAQFLPFASIAFSDFVVGVGYTLFTANESEFYVMVGPKFFDALFVEGEE